MPPASGLRGQITRGSGETVGAAIWFCDLRGFTALAERLDRDRLLACLNQYFDAWPSRSRSTAARS